MANVLFEMPKRENVQKKQTGIKLKKGQTLNDLIDAARKIVMEKLGKYKDTSKCIQDPESIERFFQQTTDIVAIDTETTGLNTFSDTLVGISLCNGIEALYIPINHKNSIYNQKLESQIPEAKIRELFKKYIHNDRYKWLYHNAKFDLAVLETFLGEPMPNPYWDTMLASQLFYQDEEHSLKFQYNKYVAEEDEGVNRFDTLFKGITFDYIPLDIATIYAGKDAFMTWELYKYQYEKMNRPDMLGIKNVFETIEMPIIPIIVKMQRVGVHINNAMMKDLYDKYNDRLQIAQKQVYDEIDKYKEAIEKYRIKNYNSKLENPINLASPTQLAILFYDILGYKTKSGKGTGVHELEEINTPLTNALLEYRKMQKLIDAFLVALPKKIEPTTGKIHTSLNQYGAETGRFSSSEPNLQQIPSRGEAKEIRRVFGAGKGNILLSSDFSQQEPRCLASIAEEENMIETYKNGKDLYSTMAAQAFHTSYEDCLEFYLDENGKKTDKTNPEGKKRRTAIKGVLLGIMYGRGVASVAESIHSTKEEAQQIIDSFFEAYPKIKIFVEERQKEAKKLGYTTTAWGRRRYLNYIQKDVYEYHYNSNRPTDFNPLFTAKTIIQENVSQDVIDDYNSKLSRANFNYKQKIINDAANAGIDIIDNESKIAEANRQVVNSIIQGSAADMSKRAMILLGTNQELKDLGFQMLFPVHDEVIAECPYVNRKRCGELMSQLMIQAGSEKINVPMKCDVEGFKVWYGEDIPLDDCPEADEIFHKYDDSQI